MLLCLGTSCSLALSCEKLISHPMGRRSTITARAPLPGNRRTPFWARSLGRTSMEFGPDRFSSQVGIGLAMTNSVWLRTVLGSLVAPISPGLLAVILAAPFRVGASGFGVRELSEAAWIIG